MFDPSPAPSLSIVRCGAAAFAIVRGCTAVTQPLAAPGAAHRVPSASPHVRLSILNIAGAEYAVAPMESLRICLNIGPAFSTETDGPGANGAVLCRQNDLLITPPDLALRHRHAPAHIAGVPRVPPTARLVVFVISLELLAACCAERGIRSRDLLMAHQAIPPNGALLSLAQALLADLGDGSPDGAGETEFLAKALLARIARQLSASPQPAAEPDAVAAVQCHIEANLASPLLLADLAAIAGMSQFHFCRVFRDATGKSPHQYILHARVQQACRLLCTIERPGASERSILDVALACGFGSSSHFATQFKRHMGQSPLQWRAGHR